MGCREGMLSYHYSVTIVPDYLFGSMWGFIGVVVITSALHAEGPGFKPQMNLNFFVFFYKKFFT